MTERAEIIRKKLAEIEAKEIELLEKMKRHKIENGSKYFRPFPHQRKFIELLHGGKKIGVFQGGNRIGKTFLAACLVDSFARGVQEWDNRPSVFQGRPTKGRIICADWEHHANEVIVPRLKEVIPKGTYSTKKNNTGVEAFWRFKNGSTIELMTHSQDTDVFEGWTGDWGWADEPLPKDKYVATRRGLVTTSGIFMFTMTALSEAWILDEIVLSNRQDVGVIGNIPMSANTLISADDIENFKQDLTEDEITARIDGGWLQLTGLVLKEFKKDVHMIRPFDVPPDWPVTPLVDIHLSKEQAIGYYAIDPNGRHFVVDETWNFLNPKGIADDIIRHKVKRSWNIRETFIDPLAKGDSAYIKNRLGQVEDSYSIIQRALWPHRIRLSVGSKDKNSGVRNLKEWLRGVNGLPIFYVFDTCEKHLWEMQRWKYDKEEKPEKLNDHFCENMYRYTLTGAKYKKFVTDDQATAAEEQGRDIFNEASAGGWMA